MTRTTDPPPGLIPVPLKGAVLLLTQAEYLAGFQRGKMVAAYGGDGGTPRLHKRHERRGGRSSMVIGMQKELVAGMGVSALRQGWDMRPPRVRADQHVLAEAGILRNVGEGAPLHPPPVFRYWEISPPPVLTAAIEDDRDLLACPEREL